MVMNVRSWVQGQTIFTPKGAALPTDAIFQGLSPDTACLDGVMAGRSGRRVCTL